MAAGCAAPGPEAVVPPGPSGPGEPQVTVGLLADAPRVQLGGGSSWRLRDASGSTRTIAMSETALVSPSGSGLALSDDDGRQGVVGPLIASAGGDGLLRVNGRDYRGSVEVRRSSNGVTVIERIGLESYLAGVVSAELGEHPEGDDQAAMAQAVVSRTYAIRNAGRWRAQGFDLAANVGDQRYDGVSGETPQSWRAVRATRGEILTWQGRPIDAFFHSTCGGTTAAASEVFSGGDRPYLRAVRDVDADGLPYCRISPRYQWREEWNEGALLAALRRTLPAEAAVAASAVTEIRDVKVTARSGSDRVSQLEIRLPGRTVMVSGASVRRVLIPPGQDVLRSAAFKLSTTTSAGRVVSLIAEGRGAGHGVGLCQWGAIGRAREGDHYPKILAAYFPGTSLTRQY